MNIGAVRGLSGEHGGRYIDPTHGTVTGNWMEIHATQAAILGATVSNIDNMPATISLVAGDRINGVFTSVTVTSGSVIAYNRKYG